MVMFNANSLLGPGPGLTGSGMLVMFDFMAIGTGTSALDIDPTTFILLDSTGASINASTTNGSAIVQGTTAVPEPSSLFLINLGLVALAALALGKRIPRRHATWGSL